MQTLDTFLDQFLDNCDESNTNGLKGSNSFLSLSDIVNSSTLTETQIEFSEETTSALPNQEIEPAEVINTISTPSNDSSSFNDVSSTIFQFNLVSKLFPLFESLFKGIQCTNPNNYQPSQNFSPANNQSAAIQHQLVQPQQVIFHTSQNPSIFTQFQTNNYQSYQPIATVCNSNSTCFYQNPQHYSNDNQLYSNSCNIVNCETTSSSTCSSSSNSSPNLVKIQKSQKTKRNVNKKKKIVLCNNEYDEKMFKLRNPNQTYYKFVER